MTTTLVGMLIERDGMFHQRVLVQPELVRTGPLSYRKPPPEIRNRYGRVDTLHLRSAQADWIGLNVEHDYRATIGSIVSLQMRRSGEVWAVATVEGELPDGPLYFSPRVATRGDGSVLIEDAAVTSAPAQICLPPVTVLPGRLDAADTAGLPEYQQEMVTRARATVHTRTLGSSLRIFDEDERRAEQREERRFREQDMIARELDRLGSPVRSRSY